VKVFQTWIPCGQTWTPCGQTWTPCGPTAGGAGVPLLAGSSPNETFGSTPKTVLLSPKERLSSRGSVLEATPRKALDLENTQRTNQLGLRPGSVVLWFCHEGTVFVRLLQTSLEFKDRLQKAFLSEEEEERLIWVCS